MSPAEFLNHIRRVLDSELQRWEFSDRMPPQLDPKLPFFGLAVKWRE